MPSDKNRNKPPSKTTTTSRSGGASSPSDSDSENFPPQSIVGVGNLTLRYDAATKLILQVNSPFANYVKSKKEDLIGKDIQILARSLSTDLFKAVTKAPEKGAALPRITDSTGLVYEVLTTKHDGVVDVVMRDMTEAQQFKSYVHRYFGLDLESLSEEDKRTLSFPERRFITISFTDLRGFTKFTEGNKPEEVRDAINAYFDEVIGAAEENGAFPNQLVGDEVMVLYGAPKHYSDHPFRAVKTACEHIERVTRLRQDYARQGKEIPHCGIGINSGEVIVGDMGSSVRDRKTYTALGTAVNLAARLCSSAVEGQIILSETTLKAVLNCLPPGWESVERFQTESEDSHEIGDETTSAKIEGVIPLPKSLAGKEILIGPGVQTKGEEPEYLFKYLHQIKAKGIASALPVLSVQRLKDTALARSILSNKTEAAGEGEMMLGPYRLVSHIGTGGMGTVWKARDEYANVLAIKMLKAGHDASASQIARFEREVKVMRKLSHRNICRIHKSGKADGRIFIAMDFIDGISLEQLISHQSIVMSHHSGTGSVVSPSRTRLATATEKSDFSSIVDSVKSAEKSKSVSAVTSMDSNSKFEIRNSNLNPEDADTGMETRATEVNRMMTIQQVLAIISNICDAVQFAHELGVLHRDLKPANIMIGRDGEPVVMDFGLAKLSERTEGDDKSLSMSLSLEGQIVGTIEYMAPEQALSSKEVSEQADVFSIGAIFYHLITGHKPFISSGNLLTDAKALQDHEPVPPRKLDRYIDQDLETIILKALQPDHKLRYRSAAQIRQDIERYQSGDPISARKPTLGYRVVKKFKKNKAAFSFGTAACALIIGFVVFAIYENLKNYGDWNRIVSEDFTDGSIAPAVFEATEKNGIKTNQLWKEEPSGYGIRLLPDQWLWLAKKIRGDAKVEVKMRYDGPPEGFQICINGNRNEVTAPEELGDWKAPEWDQNPTGYACRYGIWNGSLAIITANEFPSPGPLNRHIPAPVPSGGFTLTFQRQDGVLSMEVNKQEVHRETVLVPLSGVSKLTRYNLDLMSINSTENLRKEGKSLILAALINNSPHVRIFDASGKIVLDKPQKDLIPGADLNALLKLLNSTPLPTPSQLPLDKKLEVITNAASTSGFIQLITETDLNENLDIGFRTWSKNLVIESISVYRFTLPQEASPTVAGDALVQIGETEKALEKYLSIAEDYPEEAPGALALTKANQVWIQSYLTKKDRTPKQDKYKEEIATRLNRHPGKDTKDSAVRRIEAPLSALDLFSRGQHTEALALFDEIMQLDPNSRIVMDCLQMDHATIPAEVAQLMLPSIARTKNVGAVDLRSLKLTDISALSGILELTAVDVRENQLTHLDALIAKPLEALYCQNNQIKSLDPIRSAPLGSLYCENNEISDLGPLENLLDLYEFSCSNNHISDLSPLKGAKYQQIFCSGNKITDLSPLRGKAELYNLYCADNPISDLSPLKDVPLLKNLDISGTNVVSVAALKDLPHLETLICRNTQIADLDLLPSNVTVWNE